MSKASSQHLQTNVKVCVLGTRGFPNVQGGIEAHCEHLYSELVKLGQEVTVCTRMPYVDPAPKSYNNVKLFPISCPKSKYLEAIIHTMKGVFAARKLKPDILHIHAIGPALLTPLARAFGMKVVITHHGPDYRRAKWGGFAKLILKAGEWAGINYANAIITIANNIAEELRRKFRRSNIHIIPNGVLITEQSVTDECLIKFSLEKKKYILSVGRFVPEKGFHDLINAFQMMQDAECKMRKRQTKVNGPQSTVHSIKPNAPRSSDSSSNSQLKTNNWKLVIVGDADHEDKYSLDLKKMVRKSRHIVLTGRLTGKPLQELYSHAGLFVLPSYYEGLPIVLLEAMSYGLSCIVSDIPANRDVELSDDRFFKAGDVDALAMKLKEYVDKSFTDDERNKQLAKIAEKYNWEDIAKRTLEVYKAVCS